MKSKYPIIWKNLCLADKKTFFQHIFTLFSKNVDLFITGGASFAVFKQASENYEKIFNDFNIHRNMNEFAQILSLQIHLNKDKRLVAILRRIKHNLKR